jgi:hypothetical protein
MNMTFFLILFVELWWLRYEEDEGEIGGEDREKERDKKSGS